MRELGQLSAVVGRMAGYSRGMITSEMALSRDGNMLMKSPILGFSHTRTIWSEHLVKVGR